MLVSPPSSQREDAPPAAQASHDKKPHGKMLHPVVMMLWVLIAAVAMTWFVDSGQFERHGKLVVPGTYQVVPKTGGIATLFAPTVTRSAPDHAAPASLVSVFVAIPSGLIKNAPLIIMVMFVGGMFGVMRRTGVVDAGIDRLLQLTSGNVYILAPMLMILIGLGSTLLGFISEYLVIIPMVVLLAQRLQLSNLFAIALVAIAAKIGYVASGADGAFVADDDGPADALLNLAYAPKQGYRANGRWVMNRKTESAVRKFKDANGNYIWQPGAAAGQPATIFGYPVTEVEDMPDIASNAYAIAFGDFARGYLVVDRVGVRVLRDPYSAKPYVLFYTTKRVGGGVQNFEAIKLMKFSAS